MKMSRRSALLRTVAFAATASISRRVIAQTTQYTVEDLKSTLTPFGALRAGNVDGTIPAWTGDPIPLPAGYVSGHVRPDFFASDASILTITAANVAEHEDRLAKGDIYMLKNYAGYQMDIYPTHRTAIAPQYVYDYTYKNVSTVKLTPDENNISGVYGGIPFPIPTTGKQVIWNHLLRWSGVTINNESTNYLVTSSGEVIFKAGGYTISQWPYYINGGEGNFKGIFEQFMIYANAPAYEVGDSNLVLETVNPLEVPERAWEYEVGERRVRLAPQLTYDTPIDIVGGVIQWDEGSMFSGALDEYDCKITGKKEMYVPYNCNKAWAVSSPGEFFGPKFVKPDVMRWELHRVWVVEMTLVAGKRNVDARRTLYIDEDTWTILSLDVYDANGSLWKYHNAITAICPDVPGVVSGLYVLAYDFHSSEYATNGGYDGNQQSGSYRVINELPDSFYTPGQLSALAGGN